MPRPQPRLSKLDLLTQNQHAAQTRRSTADTVTTVTGILKGYTQDPEWRADVDVYGGTVNLPAHAGAYVIDGGVRVQVENGRPTHVLGPTDTPVPDSDVPTTVREGALPVVIQPAAMIDQESRDKANEAIQQLGELFTTSDTPPTLADGEGKPEGAYWIVVDSEGEDAARWRWVEGAWVEAPLGPELILSDAVISSLLANEIFTTNLTLADEVDGYINQTSARGVEIFGPDGFPLSRYGAFAENALNFYREGNPVASISDAGVVSGLEGAFDVLSVGGTDIGATIASRPAGIHHRTSTGISGIAKLVGRGNVALIELDVDIEEGRQYFVYVPQFTVQVGLDGRTNNRAKIDATIRYTWDGTRPNSNASVFAGAPGFVHEGENFLNITIGPRSLLRSEIPTQSGRVRLMLMLHSDGPPVSVYEGWGSIPQMLVMDAGTVVPNTGIRWTVDRGIPPGSTDPEPTPAPDPVPPTRRYTRTYNSSGWATFQNVTGNGTGSQTTSVSGPTQGATPYYPSAGQYGSHWHFDTNQIQADLAGATVISARVKITCTHSHANSGGTARLHIHGYSSAGNWAAPDPIPGADVHFSKGQSRWLGVTYQGWRTGNVRGIAVWSRGSTSTAYYMRFAPQAVLEITFER